MVTDAQVRKLMDGVGKGAARHFHEVRTREANRRAGRKTVGEDDPMNCHRIDHLLGDRSTLARMVLRLW